MNAATVRGSNTLPSVSEFMRMIAAVWLLLERGGAVRAAVRALEVHFPVPPDLFSHPMI